MGAAGAASSSQGDPGEDGHQISRGKLGAAGGAVTALGLSGCSNTTGTASNKVASKSMKAGAFSKEPELKGKVLIVFSLSKSPNINFPAIDFSQFPKPLCVWVALRKISFGENP